MARPDGEHAFRGEAVIRLRSLGQCLIEVGETRIGPNSEILFAALLYLILERGRAVPRRQLIEMLWPEVPDAAARHRLRQTLYKLKGIGVPLEYDAARIELPEDVVVDSDCVATCSASIACGARGTRSASLERRSAFPAQPEAAFLPSYAPVFSQPFSEWLESQRSVAACRARRGLVAAIAHHRARGEWESVEALAYSCLALDPLNEEATLALAEATALIGSKVQAVGLLDTYLREIGHSQPDVRLPASVLRRRISERLSVHDDIADVETPLIGRADSVAWLSARLTAAGLGKGSCCLLVGEVGIGKTRLISELARLATLQGARVVKADCRPSDRLRPMSVFTELVPCILQLPGALGCSPTSIAYLKRLTEYQDETVMTADDPEACLATYHGLRRALTDLFDSVSSECLLVVVVEDVHWLDHIAWKVLADLAQWSLRHRILVVSTAKTPECLRLEGLRLDDNDVHLLQALSREYAGALFSLLTSTADVKLPTSTRDWFIDVSGGNPLYLRELAAHWSSTGLANTIPDSLALLIEKRLSQLDPAFLDTLQAITILGKHANLRRVDRLLQLPTHELLYALDSLAKGNLIVLEDGRLSPRHDLIAEGALRYLSDVGRRLLHRSAAVILRADMEQSRSPSLLWDCAAHWRQAGECNEAVEVAHQSAKHLLALGLPGEASAVLAQALEHCTSPLQRLELLPTLCVALKCATKWRRLADVAMTTLALRAEHERPDGPHSELELVLLEAHWKIDWDMRELLGRAEICMGDEEASPLHRVQAASWAIVFADNMVDETAATRAYETTMRLGSSRTIESHHHLRVQLIYHAVYGDLERAVEIARTIIASGEGEADGIALSRACRHASVVFRRSGRFEEAERALRNALLIAEKAGMPSYILSCADHLGVYCLEEDDLEGAKHWFDYGRRWIDMSESPVFSRDILNLGAHIALAEGSVEQAMRLVGKSGYRQDDPILRRQSGELCMLLQMQLAVDGGPIDRAHVARFAQLHSRLRTRGGQDLNATVLCRALHRMGRSDYARRLLKDYVTTHRREKGRLPPYVERLLYTSATTEGPCQLTVQ
jgi:DNA-binding SARP family transcriptional activator